MTSYKPDGKMPKNPDGNIACEQSQDTSPVVIHHVGTPCNEVGVSLVGSLNPHHEVGADLLLIMKTCYSLQ